VLSGYRSGSYVYLRAYETRYNPDVSGFVAASAGTITFWGRTAPGAWWKAGTFGTYANGWTRTVKLFSPNAHYFRVTVTETTWRWGTTSATIYR
jgi:hypothetical protein